MREAADVTVDDALSVPFILVVQTCQGEHLVEPQHGLGRVTAEAKWCGGDDLDGSLVPGDVLDDLYFLCEVSNGEGAARLDILVVCKGNHALNDGVHTSLARNATLQVHAAEGDIGDDVRCAQLDTFVGAIVSHEVKDERQTTDHHDALAHGVPDGEHAQRCDTVRDDMWTVCLSRLGQENGHDDGVTLQRADRHGPMCAHERLHGHERLHVDVVRVRIEYWNDLACENGGA